jgi:hypothetical protein
MNWQSGTDVFPNPLYFWNWGGMSDGHGEIVGFRALAPLAPLLSYPLALEARSGVSGPWPALQKERLSPDPAAIRAYRVAILREWENHPEYLETHGWAPQKPPKAYCDARGFAYDSDYCTYCMVSGALCTILESTPVASAGPDQTVEDSASSSTEVTLDGSSSSDPNGYPLTFTWNWLEGTTQFHVMGETVNAHFPLGARTITLTVDNGDYIDTDTVDVSVEVPEPGAETSVLTALLVILAIRTARSRPPARPVGAPARNLR